MQYYSYLLRLWQETEEEGKWIWRASLESPLTGERFGFADLAELCSFLEEQTGCGEAQAPGEDGSRSSP